MKTIGNNNRGAGFLTFIIIVLLGLSAVRGLALPTVIDSAVNPANSHLYYLLSNSSWQDAESEAITLGGHLATINDTTENNWVWNLWGNNRSLYIGLYDPTPNDGTGAQHAADFVWSSGDTSAFRNWRPGEPNNGGTSGTLESYGYILAQGQVPGGAQWNDYTGLASILGQPLTFGIVEVVPEPSSTTLVGMALVVLATARRLVKHSASRIV